MSRRAGVSGLAPSFRAGQGDGHHQDDGRADVAGDARDRAEDRLRFSEQGRGCDQARQH